MNNKARFTKLSSILIVCSALIFLAYLIIAGDLNYTLEVNPTTFNKAEDLSYLYNITIIDINTTIYNFTRVNITFPAGASFVIQNETNGSSGAGILTITGTRLSWSGTNVTNKSAQYFWVNATALTPSGTGVYNITITVTTSGDSLNMTNITLNISDTTTPWFNFVGNSTFLGLASSATAYTNWSYIWLNISAFDNVAPYNVSILAWNATAVINITSTRTVTNISMLTNTTSGETGKVTLPNGIYYINVTVNDTSGNVNTTKRTLVIDSVTPLVEFGTGTMASLELNYTRNHININVSASDTNFANLTFFVYNDTGLVTSYTNFTATSYAEHNFTALNDGNYSYQVNITDLANNKNATLVRKIVIDANAPVMTYSCSPLSVTVGSEITCSCTVTDYDPSPTIVYTEHPATSVSGAYITNCTATDFSGNQKQTEITYGVTTSSSGSGSSGGGSTWTNTYIPLESQLTAGYEQKLAVKEKVKVTIANAAHYAGITALTATTATFEVASTPISSTLNIGDTKKFDVTGDGYYDLSVTLNSIASNKADVTLKKINELIPAAAEEEKSGVQGAIDQAAENVTENVKKVGSSWWIIALIVVIVIIVIVLLQKQRKSRYYKKGY